MTRIITKLIRRLVGEIEWFFINAAAYILGFVVKSRFRRYPCSDCLYAGEFIELDSPIGSIRFIYCVIHGTIPPVKWCPHYRRTRRRLIDYVVRGRYEFIDDEVLFVQELRKYICGKFKLIHDGETE